MSDSIRITCLVENTVRRQGCLGEHGLAYWIEAAAGRVLFDTGGGQTLAVNARRLGIDVAQADAIVVSHGHYDHTGDLRFAFTQAQRAMLFLHPGATRARYSGRIAAAQPGLSTRDGDMARGRAVGLASMSEPELRQAEPRVTWTSRPTEVLPNLFATGEIPRLTDYEDTGGALYLDADCRMADPIQDDQALYMDTEGGIVVILGCAHAGIINTLTYVRQLSGGPIHAVIGGTHLLNASPQRLSQTIAALRAMDLKLIAPAHCTGPRASAALWTAFPDQIADSCVGAQWTFKQPSEGQS
jgi:7,8-dihydropterin-6-yl-methyl-4-(beta-D-ribofuranosyl)aminobenzene 5'-phosphate synthase